jgi:hypothetical protein
LPELYSALDVYLLTSRVEGGPCTVFEAMACETAVVSTRVGAVPNLIIDGVNGYSADVDDVQALVGAVVVLGSSRERRDEIRMNGRNTVSTMPWGAALGPLEGVYDALTEPRMRSGVTTQGPAWMRDPQALLHTSLAGDAVANVIDRVRKHTASPVQGMRLLIEMLDRKSPLDVVKGLAMVRGMTHKMGSGTASERKLNGLTET